MSADVRFVPEGDIRTAEKQCAIHHLVGAGKQRMSAFGGRHFELVVETSGF
jgi:hypothetical protein